MGLGALLVDGIFLHQIVQSHNMVSGWVYPDTIESARLNMFYDGMFHLLTWVLTALGVMLLYNCLEQKNIPRSTRALLGAMVFGFGLFNTVEGIIDHHLLGIHHTVELAPQPQKLYWDLVFLLFGGGIPIAIGMVQVYKAKLDLEKI